MKQLLMVFATLLMTVRIVLAQETDKAAAAPVEKIVIEVKESKERMSLGVNNCLQVYIPGASKEDVERDLLKYMKNYNVKGDARKSEYFFDNAEIKVFGNNLVDVYAQVEQKAGGVDLKVFFDLGGAFISSAGQPDKYKSAESIVRKFARDEAVAAVGIEITAAQRVLDAKMRDFDNLVRQDSAYSKKIRDCQLIINQAVIDQKANRLSQDTKKEELELEQQMIEGLKSKQAGID
ncbi:MAG: hypothetical protein K1X61_08005 [Chitinophagales bacterium]|nr:hypothetical protein [Chitinophagales bacterium]